MKKNILIVLHINLYPIVHGNQRRVKAFIDGLRSFGYRVVLIANINERGVSPKGQKLKKRITEMKKLVDVFIPVSGPYFAGKLNKFDISAYLDAIEKALPKYGPIAVVAEYIWMAPCLDKVKNGAIKIIDTHDVMHIRKSIYAKKGINPWVICTRKQETRLLRKADVIIGIQKHELKIFKKMVPEKKVIYVPHFPGLKLERKRKKIKKDIVMVIGSDNSANTYSIKKFLEVAWPLIKKECPNAELHVYGNLVNKVPKNIKGVFKKSFVRDLNKIYKNAKVVINPTLLGTGLKIKTVEALYYGKALVTTKSGAEGLEKGSGKSFVVTDDLERFGKEVVRLLNNVLARKKLEKEALKFAKANFSKEAVFKDLINVLKKSKK